MATNERGKLMGALEGANQFLRDGVSGINSINPLSWALGFGENYYDDPEGGIKGALSKTYDEHGAKAAPMSKRLASGAVSTAKGLETAWKGERQMRKEYGPAMVDTVPIQDSVTAARESVFEAEQQFKKNQSQNIINELGAELDKGYTVSQVSAGLEANKANLSPENYMLAKQHLMDLEKKEKNSGPVQDEQINKVKQQVTNLSQGNGDAMGNQKQLEPKEAPEEEKTKGVIDVASNNMVERSRTPLNWYDSDAFSNSLITFGLGLLSGQDYATAWGAASTQFDDRFAKEQRATYAEELRAAGYSDPQILEWIDKNDASVLQLRETWKTDKDSYGSFQQSSLTGKKDYMPNNGKVTWREATRNIGGQTIYGQENSLGNFNPYGATFQSGSGKGKGPSEMQAKAIFGANRAEFNNNVWNKARIADDYPLATAQGNLYVNTKDDSTIKNIAGTISPELQNTASMERGYLAGVLRPESDAAISDSEWSNYGHIFFPRRGNTPQQIAQKAWLRDMTVLTLRQIGDQYDNDNEREISDQVIRQMINKAGDVVDYDPNQGAVKMSDGKWYQVNLNNY